MFALPNVEEISGFIANSNYKIQALFKDFQRPKLHFSSTKIIDKKPYPRRGHSKFRLQCDTEDSSVQYCTHQYRNDKSKRQIAVISLFLFASKLSTNLNSRTFQGLSSTFKHVICFQALSRALKFLFQIQAFSRISQARYEPWDFFGHRE